MNKIKWAILGPGIIAHKFAEVISLSKNAELVAVASTSETRAHEFAEKYNIAHTYSSYEELACSGLIDAVYISTAHPFHTKCAKIFLEKKIPVLCEKPMCVNSRQAKELTELARNNEVFLMEAMWTKFLPFFENLKTLIGSGVVGEVKSIHADFCYSIEREEDPKLFENTLAGGSLLDVGVYCLHFVYAIFNDTPTNIRAIADTENGIDKHTQAILEFESGKSACVSSAIKLEKPFDAYIYGTEGYIHIPNFYKADSFTVTNGENKQEYSFPYSDNGFEFEIDEVCECIKASKLESSKHSLADTICILEQMDEIRKQIGIVYPFD